MWPVTHKTLLCPLAVLLLKPWLKDLGTGAAAPSLGWPAALEEDTKLWAQRPDMTDTNEQPLSFLLPTIPPNLKSAVFSLSQLRFSFPSIHWAFITTFACTTLYHFSNILYHIPLLSRQCSSWELQTPLLNLVCRWPMKQPRLRATQEEHQTSLTKTWINCRLRFKEALLN